MERLVLGSVAEEVVRRAPCPVLVARGGEGSWPPSTIVVGDDSSHEAKEAGELAARVGGPFGTDAVLVRAYPRPPREVEAAETRRIEEELRWAEEALEERAGELEGQLGRRPQAKVAMGDAAALILDEARRTEPALIAVGRRGFGGTGDAWGAETTLGSVSTKVLRAALGPVLVCPPRPGGRNGGP